MSENGHFDPDRERGSDRLDGKERGRRQRVDDRADHRWTGDPRLDDQAGGLPRGRDGRGLDPGQLSGRKPRRGRTSGRLGRSKRPFEASTASRRSRPPPWKGSGTINVELLLGADKDRALNDVKSAIDRITSFPRRRRATDGQPDLEPPAGDLARSLWGHRRGDPTRGRGEQPPRAPARPAHHLCRALRHSPTRDQHRGPSGAAPQARTDAR